MVVCAAIKYYIEATHDSVVLCGGRHHNIINQLKFLGFEPHQGYKEMLQGFVNEAGRFMTREEALREATRCGQLSATTLHAKEERNEQKLFSEDLY